MSEIYELEAYTSYDENGPYFDPYARDYDDDSNDLWGEEDDSEYWLNESRSLSVFLNPNHTVWLNKLWLRL